MTIEERARETCMALAEVEGEKEGLSSRECHAIAPLLCCWCPIIAAALEAQAEKDRELIGRLRNKLHGAWHGLHDEREHWAFYESCKSEPCPTYRDLLSEAERREGEP